MKDIMPRRVGKEFSTADLRRGARAGMIALSFHANGGKYEAEVDTARRVTALYARGKFLIKVPFKLDEEGCQAVVMALLAGEAQGVALGRHEMQREFRKLLDVPSRDDLNPVLFGGVG